MQLQFKNTASPCDNCPQRTQCPLVELDNETKIVGCRKYERDINTAGHLTGWQKLRNLPQAICAN